MEENTALSAPSVETPSPGSATPSQRVRKLHPRAWSFILFVRLFKTRLHQYHLALMTISLECPRVRQAGPHGWLATQSASPWASRGQTQAPIPALPRAGCVTSRETLNLWPQRHSAVLVRWDWWHLSYSCLRRVSRIMYITQLTKISGTYSALVADLRPLPALRSRALLRVRLSALLHPGCPGLSAQSVWGRAAQGGARCRAKSQRLAPRA